MSEWENSLGVSAKQCTDTVRCIQDETALEGTFDKRPVTTRLKKINEHFDILGICFDGITIHGERCCCRARFGIKGLWSGRGNFNGER